MRMTNSLLNIDARSAPITKSDLNSETPFLDRYTDNLSETVEKNPDEYQVYGRNDEILDVMNSLLRKNKNSPLLVGDPGVGKTAIVEGLALRIYFNDVPERLRNLNVRSLELSSLMNEQEGGFIYKFKSIINELVETKGENLLFIDEIHTIMGAGGNGQALDAGNVLKPVLARGEIQIIGATTIDEYHESIEQDKALERRFQKILIDEPTTNQTIQILNSAKGKYESFHGVKIKKEALFQAVNLSVRYIPDRFLPDKAFDLIDEAATIVSSRNEEIVTAKDIAFVLRKRTGIPVTTILKDEASRLNNMPQRLAKRVKGQDHAIMEVSDAVTIIKAGLQNENKPASFIFLGTTGVGKTELAKALAEVLFDDENAMIRFDMSEYNFKGAAAKLIGTRKEKGNLTEAVKNKPYSIVLFDEIEKDQVGETHDLLLQIMDDGRLTDGTGRLVSFKNTIIILTTNVGAEKIRNNAELKGDIDKLTEREYQQFMESMDVELQTEFRPEFLNRIDYKIIFKMLVKSVIKEIAVKDLDILNERMRNQKSRLSYDPEVLDYLADLGTDANNGARPLARLINRKIIAPIADQMLRLPKRKGIWNFHISVNGKAPNNIDELLDKRQLVFNIQLLQPVLSPKL